MSQTPSHALDLTWLSVPFAKFSHNSSPSGTRNFTWNHVGARNDLDFVIRNTRTVDENGNFHTRILMKINAGAEELELQDLGELVQHLHVPSPSSGGESPVQVVIKSPFLAMRYPKPGNIVRRIQLKFHSDYDFTKVLNFVKDVGLPITVAPPTVPSISRPGVSPSPSLLSATSVSSSLTIPCMTSASSASSSGTRISLPTPGLSLHPAIRPSTGDRLYEIAPDSSSNPQFKVPMRPNSSVSDVQRSTIYAAPQISRPATTSNFFPSPMSSSLTGLDLPHSCMRQPTSVYISQMERESPSRSRGLSHPLLPITTSSQGDSCPNLSLYQSHISFQDQSASEKPEHPERVTKSPFFAPRNTSPELGGNFTRELDPSSSNNDTQRSDPLKLSSALFGTGEGLNLWVPPRRELPFPKPREVSMQRSASISDMPPLPKPTPITRPGPANLTTTKKVSTLAPKPVKKRVAQRKAPVVKAPEIAESPSPGKGSNMDAAASQKVPQDEPSPLAAKSAAAAAPRPTSAASGLQSKAVAPKKRAAPTRPASAAKRAKMVDQATQTQTLSGRDHTSALQSFRNEEPLTLVVAAPTPRSTPAPPPPIPPPPPPETYLDAVDAFVTKHKARPPPQELWERPGYAEADVEERQLLLNNFICENLENKDFIQLCEDTSNAWRRIGLGM